MSTSLPPSLHDELVAAFRARREAEADAEATLTVGWPAYSVAEVAAALDALLDLRLSMGPRVRAFEEACAEYVGVRHGIAVNSGSSANLVVLTAFMETGRLRPGDEVVVPATTFATVVSPLYQLGLAPVYVDVDEPAWGMDPEEAERAVGPRTRALMPVHTLGYPAAMDRLMEIAHARDLIVLEDCCEAHGARWHGRVVGSMGHASTLSFFVAHNITTGEGGMIFTSDDDLAETCRSLREFGRRRNTAARFVDDGALRDYDVRYVFERSGFNVRMTDVTAALGLVQVARLEALNAERRQRVARLREILAAFAPALEVPPGHPDTVSANYGFPIRVGPAAGFTRRALCEHLESEGIETRAIMGGSLPDQPAFRNERHRIVGDLARARRLRDRAFLIGCHPAVTEAQLARVEDALGRFVTAPSGARRGA